MCERIIGGGTDTKLLLATIYVTSERKYRVLQENKRKREGREERGDRETMRQACERGERKKRRQNERMAKEKTNKIHPHQRWSMYTYTLHETNRGI